MHGEQATQIAIQRALQDGIASTVEGLTVRELMPGFDLLDENKNTINYSWAQTYTADNVDQLIYGGINDNDSKVIVIYAIQAVVGTTTLHASTVKFDTGSSVKDIVDIQRLSIGAGSSATSMTVGLHPFIVYGKNQTARIYFHTNTGAIGQTDHIILLGVVAEKRGDHIA